MIRDYELLSALSRIARKFACSISGMFGLIGITIIGIVVLGWDPVLGDSVQPSNPATASPYVPEGYKLVWFDEFDGIELDSSKWIHRAVGRPRRGGIISADATFLDGVGNLVIETRKVGNEFQSGMVSTQRSYRVKYGYFEARMKFPVHGGQNSGFWLQSPGNTGASDDPGVTGVEIDIIEFYRGRRGGHAANVLHWGGYGDNHEFEKYSELFDDNGDWHTFGLLWTESGYTFYRNGQRTWHISQFVSHVAEYIILSTVIGQRSNALDNVSLPDRFLIDYVRVYAANDPDDGGETDP